MAADPTGSLLVTIRDFPAVAALTSGRVRGGEPGPGDALGAGHYQAFVVLSRLGSLRLPHAPIQGVRLVARCYGVTAQGAAALAGAVSDAIHDRGHRINGSGVAIFSSFDDGGLGADRDPDTSQPLESILIQVGASTELLT
jgi:hypothetical protein